MSNVVALAGWSPEVLAYAMAMYSRSSLSIKESIVKITDEKATGFLESFYFKYGHKSIADNAHIPLAIEDISEIAAFELEDQQLWDGQERSTRYQKTFKKYFIPTEIKNTPLESEYCRIADFLLDQNNSYSEWCFEALVKKYPKPEDMKDADYERTLKARAFDVARYWLFNGILTSVGQITSARSLEDQICRMMASEYPEVVEIADQMKTACQAKPFAPENREEPPVAPTLVKYTNPNSYLIRTREYMKEVIGKYKEKFSIEGLLYGRYASLVTSSGWLSIRNEILAGLMYEASNKDFWSISGTVLGLEDKEVNRILGDILSMREKHDSLPRAFAAGYSIKFDILMDNGGRRDLHRHRNCIQLHQRFTVDRGFDVPDFVKEIGKYDHYVGSMSSVLERIRKLSQVSGGTEYLIPFAFRAGTLYKMDYRQAEYMTVVRSTPQGHFSYRQIVCEMDDQLRGLMPGLESYSRVTPFSYEDPFKR